jgi:hypothetical protein
MPDALSSSGFPSKTARVAEQEAYGWVSQSDDALDDRSVLGWDYGGRTIRHSGV